MRGREGPATGSSQSSTGEARSSKLGGLRFLVPLSTDFLGGDDLAEGRAGRANSKSSSQFSAAALRRDERAGFGVG